MNISDLRFNQYVQTPNGRGTYQGCQIKNGELKALVSHEKDPEHVDPAICARIIGIWLLLAYDLADLQPVE